MVEIQIVPIKYKDKRIGYVVGKIYYTTRKPEHFMKVYNGFGMSKSILDRLHNRDIRWISIKYIGKTGTFRYSCHIDKFLNSKKTYIFNDNDIQHFVSIPDMELYK